MMTAAAQPTTSGFPDGFLMGVAVSTFQNSGDPNSNWGYWENQKLPTGQPTIYNGDKCGVSGDFWNRYEEDIAAARKLGCTCFRLSIEWGRIERVRGKIDSNALERFKVILQCIRKYQMEPVATLHHFVHPQWFESLGGFAKVENLEMFVRYCEVAFEYLHPYCSMWSTFNEPGVFTIAGYLLGAFPPGHWVAFKLAGTVLRNLMMCHCVVYYRLKASPGGQHVKIGLVHNVMRFEARSDFLTRWAAYPRLCASIADHCWANEVLVEFFKTGRYRWRPLGRWLPGVVDYDWPTKPPLDWIGLNYYSRSVVNYLLSPCCYPGEIMTDMPYALYPDGFFEAIKLVSEIGVPIYITETGVADKAAVMRPQFMQSYFTQVIKAFRAGLDVRGLMYWTLMDNFEWAFGFSMKFGLEAWDHTDPQQTRKLRHGAEGFTEWAEKLKKEHALAKLQFTKENEIGKTSGKEKAKARVGGEKKETADAF